ncbi:MULTISPECIES: hypothetical protein [unclassified Streptomyces]|uniref:hypothetical protein n=1 Tax=unclassified Streptomyces TaxID=2593676 RepID=UPI00117C87B6|nr:MULTISPECIES: hypothetical protein [unclassified Streptomyces]MYT97341.1 hypothetical protein [Streptomyces sp. SID8350]
MHAHDAAVPDTAPLCEVPWGICPDHGPTVTSSAGRSWCHFPECGRRWSYDRLDQPCAELATHRITDGEGGSITACSVHAAEAVQQIDGAVVEPL